MKFYRIIMTLMLSLAPILVWAGPVEDRAMFLAIRNLNSEALLDSLSDGANPNANDPDSDTFVSSLKTLVVRTLEFEEKPENVTKIAKILFDNGAKLNPYEGHLFLPIASGNLSLVQLLIEQGADVNLPIEGFTPHQIAIKYKQPTIANFLESKGALPTNPQKALEILLVQAVSDNDIEAIERILTENVDINSDDGTGKTPLIQAIRSGIYTEDTYNIVKYLLEHGADPNKKGESGFRGISGIPLHIFVAMNQLTMNAFSSDKNSRTKKVSKLSKKILVLLLDKGAKVSAMDDSGKTPLHIAANFNNVEAAKVLIRRGAKIAPKDKYGKMPLDYAESSEMIDLLRKNGAKEF